MSLIDDSERQETVEQEVRNRWYHMEVTFKQRSRDRVCINMSRGMRTSTAAPDDSSFPRHHSYLLQDRICARAHQQKLMQQSVMRLFSVCFRLVHRVSCTAVSEASKFCWFSKFPMSESTEREKDSGSFPYGSSFQLQVLLLNLSQMPTQPNLTLPSFWTHDCEWTFGRKTIFCFERKKSASIPQFSSNSRNCFRCLCSCISTKSWPAESSHQLHGYKTWKKLRSSIGKRTHPCVRRKRQRSEKYLEQNVC